MEEYLSNFLVRINDKTYVELPDSSRTSEGSISWTAYRETDNFDKLEALEPLKQLLAKEKKVANKQQLYRLISKLAMVHHRADLIEYVLEKLKKETSSFLISFTLSHFRFYEKPATLALNMDKFREQLMAYSKSKDYGVKSSSVDFLHIFDPKMPKRSYKMLFLLRGVKDKYKNKLPENWDDLDAVFTIPKEQKAVILKRLLAYKYQISSETADLTTLIQTTEKEVFCEIHAKHVLFYTTDFNESSLFEVRQTPCEFADDKAFKVFDVQDERWV